jgi:NADH:ubiquinone oxidoreductase subunit C
MTQYKTLIAITAADFLENTERFKIFYFLLSYKLNNRLILSINTTDKIPISSITSLYQGANWYEREVWDLFGIFFINHPDLRRILTDYGFEGFPFRKDFPQTGFVEIRYDDEKKYVLYEALELTQEYRFFKYINP